jgi:hypothetical protein
VANLINKGKARPAFKLLQTASGALVTHALFLLLLIKPELLINA